MLCPICLSTSVSPVCKCLTLFQENIQKPSSGSIYKAKLLFIKPDPCCKQKTSKENAGRTSLCQDWLPILSTLLLNSLPETGVKRSLLKAALVVLEKMELRAPSLRTADALGGSSGRTLAEGPGTVQQ